VHEQGKFSSITSTSGINYDCHRIDTVMVLPNSDHFNKIVLRLVNVQLLKTNVAASLRNMKLLERYG